MGQVRDPLKVCLVCALTFTSTETMRQAESHLIDDYGEIILSSPIYKFDHTSYYTEEMGDTLFKYFIAFKDLIDPGVLPVIKICTNRIEAGLCQQDRRTVNLDPGYVEAAKLVLATTKNYEHRIYIGTGIYGDVQLRFRKDGIQFNPWTYPDYKESIVLEFFAKVKIYLMKQLRNQRE